VIVMPVTTPQLKIDAVKALGGDVVLHGDSYSDAYGHAKELCEQQGLTFIHPFDDPDVIAGQGTIAMEILRQHQGPLDAVFVAIGGGGLISGVANYIKAVRPEIKVIGVQMNDSDAMQQSVAARKRVTLGDVGLFSDGTAVKLVGEETFRIARELVDEFMLVDTDAVCAAIKDVFVDTRSIVEPAGALAVAAIKQYVAQNKTRGETYAAILCGANMNFDRLRFVAERAEVGEEREALFAVTIPEERGSFKRFCELIGTLPGGARNVTEFNYRISDEAAGARVRRPHHARQGRVGPHRRQLHAPRLRGAGPHPRRTGQGTPAPHGRRPFRAGARRAPAALRLPGAAGRADEVPLPHAPDLEHLAVPLPQPGRRLRPHPGRHPGAGQRRQGVPGLPRHAGLSVRRGNHQPGLPPVPAQLMDLAARATGFLRHYLLAVQFFTRLPVTGALARWVGFSPDMLRASAAHFPGVGWLVGLAACVAFAGLSWVLPATVFTPLGRRCRLDDLHRVADRRVP
jgi:threonine dehydratase